MRRSMTYWVPLLSLVLSLGGCSSARNEAAAETGTIAVEETFSESVGSDSEEETDDVYETETSIPETEETVPETEEETAPETLPAPESADTFVRVADYIPDIVVELKYSTEDNFTGTVIYDFHDAYLRYGTVVKLAAVQNELREQGLSLKIWDAFRPIRAQYRLWEIVPDPTYVANPNNGVSSHSRGNTVDVTLVDSDGNELPMPTGFDDFSTKADRDYSDVNSTAAENALFLEKLMKRHDFKPYSGEWWHFSDNQKYPAGEDFIPAK